MGYGFTCDVCGDVHPDDAPPLMGEFRETFLKTTDSPLGQVFQPGETVTICQGCSEDYVL